MTTPVEGTIEALQDLVETNRKAREVLALAEEESLRSIAELEAGVAVSTIVQRVQPGGYRRSIQDALDAVGAARHRYRLEAIAACIEDGMTPREIAEAWGISRQRVDQFVQERRRTTES